MEDRAHGLCSSLNRTAKASRDITENINPGRFLSIIYLRKSLLDLISLNHWPTRVLKTATRFQSQTWTPHSQESHLSLLKEWTDLVKEPVLECQKSVFWWQRNLKYRVVSKKRACNLKHWIPKDSRKLGASTRDYAKFLRVCHVHRLLMWCYEVFGTSKVLSETWQLESEAAHSTGRNPHPAVGHCRMDYHAPCAERLFLKKF